MSKIDLYYGVFVNALHPSMFSHSFLSLGFLTSFVFVMYPLNSLVICVAYGSGLRFSEIIPRFFSVSRLSLSLFRGAGIPRHMDAVRATSMNVRFGKSFSSRNFLSPDLHLTSLPNLLSLTIKE
jgi:hypothetical protein